MEFFAKLIYRQQCNGEFLKILRPSEYKDGQKENSGTLNSISCLCCPLIGVDFCILVKQQLDNIESDFFFFSLENIVFNVYSGIL